MVLGGTIYRFPWRGNGDPCQILAYFLVFTLGMAMYTYKKIQLVWDFVNLPNSLSDHDIHWATKFNVFLV
jgi:hypothetical protein